MCNFPILIHQELFIFNSLIDPVSSIFSLLELSIHFIKFQVVQKSY